MVIQETYSPPASKLGNNSAVTTIVVQINHALLGINYSNLPYWKGEPSYPKKAKMIPPSGHHPY
jgi:hypothetical protein